MPAWARPPGTDGRWRYPHALVGLERRQADAHDWFLLADDAEPHLRWTMPNSTPGAAALGQTLAPRAQQHAIPEPRIGMGAIGMRWWRLSQQLAHPRCWRPLRCRALPTILGAESRVAGPTHDAGCDHAWPASWPVGRSSGHRVRPRDQSGRAP